MSALYNPENWTDMFKNEPRSIKLLNHILETSTKAEREEMTAKSADDFDECEDYQYESIQTTTGDFSR